MLVKLRFPEVIIIPGHRDRLPAVEALCLVLRRPTHANGSTCRVNLCVFLLR